MNNLEKDVLRAFDLDLLTDNINYYIENRNGVTWSGQEGHFAYPMYPEGMRLYDLICYMGGFDQEYDRHVKEIFLANLMPSELSYEQIRSYLTFILRGEKFCDGHIDMHLKNKVLLKLCLRLDDLVRREMYKERPRCYILHYLQSLKANVYQKDNLWILKESLDKEGQLNFYVVFKDNGDFVTFKLESLKDQMVYEFDRESIIRKLQPYCYIQDGHYKLLGQLLKEEVEHNGDMLLRKLIQEQCTKGAQRHFRVDTGLVFKVDQKNMTAYRYQPETQTWNLDLSLFVDFEQGNILQYEEINMEDYYPVIKKGPQVSIGRAEVCDIVLKEPYASKMHAQLLYNEENWVINDLLSKNGVIVNGEKVLTQTLKMGDKIKIGLTTIYFYGTYIDVVEGMTSKEYYLEVK